MGPALTGQFSLPPCFNSEAGAAAFARPESCRGQLTPTLSALPVSGLPLGSVSGGGKRSREEGLRPGSSGALSWKPVFARRVFQVRCQPRWCLSDSVFRAGLGSSSIQRRPSMLLCRRCLSGRPATHSRWQQLSHELRPSQVPAETWRFPRRCAIVPPGACQCAGLPLSSFRRGLCLLSYVSHQCPLGQLDTRLSFHGPRLTVGQPHS